MILTIPDVMSPDEIKELRALLAVCFFEDGAITAGSQAKRAKKNEQLARSDQRMPAIEKRVRETPMRGAEFRRATLPKSIRPCLISRYQPGMQYGRHVDNAIIGADVPVRSDIAVTLFLTEPVDYEGGELVIHGTFGQQEVKLPQG